MTKLDFLKIQFLPRKFGKWGKNGQEIESFKFIGKFSFYLFIYLFWSLIHDESFYYLLHPFTNPIFGKIMIPEIRGKILLASEIVEFLNQLYLQNKTMKKPDLLYVDTNLWKLKVN